ncbi:MAG: hypothetical protein KDK76_03740 [Chlamydiia bacterium]|nr:hypothetical protein [Chlamydiia bacterium]
MHSKKPRFISKNDQKRLTSKDAEIIQHPEWHKIREYARLVYEELSGDRLDQSSG